MQNKPEINPQDFFSGKVSKDVLAHLYTFLPSQSLFALSTTCKASRRVFKELTNTFYFIPDESLPITRVDNGCSYSYLLPPADVIIGLYKEQANKVCYRTFRDAQSYIEHLYHQRPHRQDIPPIIELVFDNARALPSLKEWEIRGMGCRTIPRMVLNLSEDVFRMTRATFLKRKSRLSSALVPIVNARGESHVELDGVSKDSSVARPKPGCAIQ